MRRLATVVLLASGACTFNPAAPTFAPDAGLDASSTADATAPDVGSGDAGFVDTGLVEDGGRPDSGEDAGPDDGLDAEVDGGPDASLDAGFPDAAEDAGSPDADLDAAVDAGFPDAAVDAGFPDAAEDAGFPDAGSPDAAEDAGPLDVGLVDAGLPDSGVVDVDAAVLDAAVPLAAVALEWANAPASLLAGDCVGVTVQRIESNGQPIAEPFARTVALTALGGGIFTDSGCASAAASITLGPGVTGTVVYFGARTAGTATFDATSANLSPAQATLTVDPGAPSRLRVTPAGVVPWNACSGAQAVTVTDDFDNPVPPTGSTRIDLVVNPAGAGIVAIDGACNLPVPSVSIAPFQTGATFYVRAFGDGSFDVTASAAGLAPQTVTYTASQCANGCNMCSGGACCRAPCGGGDCGLTCNSNCQCQLDCEGTQGTCSPQCNAASFCAINCRGVNNCNATCSSASSCVIDCDGANNCDQIQCNAAGRCLVLCGSANNCSFSQCQAGATSCPDGSIACGRLCP